MPDVNSMFDETGKTESKLKGSKRPRGSRVGNGLPGIMGGLVSRNNGLTQEHIDLVKRINETPEVKADSSLVCRIFGAGGNMGNTYTTLIFMRKYEDESVFAVVLLPDPEKSYQASSDIMDVLDNNVGKIEIPGESVNTDLLKNMSDALDEMAGGGSWVSADYHVYTDPLDEKAAADIINTCVFIIDNYDGVLSNEVLMDSIEAMDGTLKVLIKENLDPDGLKQVTPYDIRKVGVTIDNLITVDSGGIGANTGGSSVLLSSADFYVTPVPIEGEGRYKETKLAPKIVMNNVTHLASNIIPTLLSLYGGAVLSAKRGYLKPLVRDVKNGVDVGAVSTVLTNRDGEYEQRLVLTSKNSTSEVTEELDMLIEDSPIYSMFIRPGYSGAIECSIFLDLYYNVKGAGEQIIDTLVEMTDGGFDETFNPADIIVSGVKRYSGVVNVDGTTTSTDVFDLPKIVSLSLDSKSLSDSTVNTFIGLTVEDASDMERLEILNQLGLEAYFNVQGIELLFTGKFMDELITSMKDTLFDGKLDRVYGLDITDSRGTLDMLGSTYSSATTAARRSAHLERGRGRRFDHRRVDRRRNYN